MPILPWRGAPASTPTAASTHAGSQRATTGQKLDLVPPAGVAVTRRRLDDLVQLHPVLRIEP